MQSLPRRRHRHTVALPLFMMVAVAFLSLDTALYSPLEQAEPLVHAAALPPDLLIRSSTGTLVKTGADGVAFLVQGEAFFRAREKRTIRLSCGTVQLLSSAAYIQSVDEETCTVAPLDGIALFHGTGSTYLAVLPNTQVMTAPHKRPALGGVSSSWMQEQHRILGPAAPHDQLIDASDEQSLRSDEDSFIHAYIQLLGPRTDDHSRADGLRTLLRDSVYAPSFLSSFPLLSKHETMTLSQTEVRTWTDAVLVQGMRDRTIADRSINGARDAARSLSDDEFPRSSQHWSEAAATLSTVFPGPSRSSSQLAEEALITSTQQRWSPKDLQAAAEAMLRRTGFLVPMNATIQPDVTRSTVTIDGVFFAEHGQDVPYAFTYDPEKDLLQSIVRDGQAWPNALTVTQFLSLAQQ
mgnify:CR=1 FL=1